MRRLATAQTRADDATGNAQGNIILFEPSTSEHLSARTIFDPITAIAPASDCRTFAHYSHHSPSFTHSPPQEVRLLLRGFLGMGPPPSKSLRCWPLKHQMVTLECGVSQRARMVLMRHASFVCSTSPSKENPVLAGSRGRKMDG